MGVRIQVPFDKWGNWVLVSSTRLKFIEHSWRTGSCDHCSTDWLLPHPIPGFLRPDKLWDDTDSKGTSRNWGTKQVHRHSLWRKKWENLFVESQTLVPIRALGEWHQNLSRFFLCWGTAFQADKLIPSHFSDENHPHICHILLKECADCSQGAPCTPG